MTKSKNYQNWQGKFAEFARCYGVVQLANVLGLHPTAVYHWLEGRNGIEPRHARKIVEISMISPVPLSLEDVFSYREKLLAAASGK
jgi:DNA-binding transcriptional regulator YdaS (Cro superfamily)